MHRTVKAVLAAAGALLLCGDALAQEIRIPRKGSSPGFHRPPAQGTSSGWFDDASWAGLEEDDEDDGADECRKRTAGPGPDVETQNVVVSYLIGGILGALIASSTGDEVRKHVGDTSRRLKHAECMAKRRSVKRPDDDD